MTETKVSRHATTSYNRFCRVRNAIRDLHSTVRHFRLTFEDYLDRRSAIFATRDYKRLTAYQHGYISAMGDMFFDAVHREVVHKYQIDGEWMTTDDMRARGLDLMLCSNAPSGTFWPDGREWSTKQYR